MKIKFLKNKYFFSLAAILIISGSFLIGKFAYAGFEEVAIFLGKIISLIIEALGALLTVLISGLIWVAGYNDFITSSAVTNGWVIVRDLCNMFFILILLVIAFATILRQENYSIKKLLPKLLIMAVLINFSKTICGIFIDFAQVIMLTFVNSFKEIGGGNLTEMLGLDKIMSINADKATLRDEKITGSSIFGSYMLALLYVIISIVVIITIIAVLVMRMVMLWIYIVLSPLAYLLAAFPAGQKYASQWWSEFSKNVVVGPVLAFFIWLSFVSASTGLVDIPSSSSDPSVAATVAGSRDNIIKFIISIGMLLGGLMVAQQAGGAAGSIAGKGLAKAQGVLTGAAKLAASPLKGAKMGIGAIAGFGINTLHQGTGIDLNLPRAWKTLQASREAKRNRMYAEGMEKAGMARATGGRIHGLLATTGDPGGAWDQITRGYSLRHPFTITKGIKQMVKGGRAMAEERERLLPEIEQAKFEADFSLMNRSDRGQRVNELTGEKGSTEKRLNDLTRESYNLDESIAKKEEEIRKSTDTDQRDALRNKQDRLKERRKKVMEEIDPLAKKRESINSKLKFAQANKFKNFSDDERAGLRQNAEEKQKQLDRNVPIYSFEAKAAGEKAVSVEMGNIKEIDDASELVRMLKEAISGGEKSKVKAIMRKLAADANDNEAFEALVPEAGSGYEGLQALMRGLSDKNNKELYAGFDEQEAMALGAQVAEMNKKTNHWEATAAYVMENGEWREATVKEHAEIASTEFGKNAPRANARSFNRLAMGKHVVDPKTGEKSYKLADIGLIALQSWDNPTSIDRMLEDMTESTAKFLVPFLDKLEDQNFFKAKGPKPTQFIKRDGSLSDGKNEIPNLADMIRTKANQAKVNFDPQFDEVTKTREEVNKED
ncbi:MAG: hypothetical protein PHQ42_01630 [Patescibacteria group bacterium]|nr:hypothetical protein [Patescibacteria group bacterium]